jgi:hypothetical protein
MSKMNRSRAADGSLVKLMPSNPSAAPAESIALVELRFELERSIASSFGHVRQFDRVSEMPLTRAWSLGGRSGRAAHDHRPGLHNPRGLREPERGRLLGLHPGARLSLTRRDPRRHRRDSARALSRGCGQHPTRREAFRARSVGMGASGRSERTVDAAQ